MRKISDGFCLATLGALGRYYKDPSLWPRRWAFETTGGATGHLSPHYYLNLDLGCHLVLFSPRGQSKGGQRAGESGSAGGWW